MQFVCTEWRYHRCQIIKELLALFVYLGTRWGHHNL